MIQAQDWNTANTTYTYNAFGQLATLSRPNGVNTNFDYDAAQRLNGLAHMRAGNQTVGAYQYAFDAMGNRTAVTETIASPLIAPNTLDPIFANGFENNGTGAWSATSGTGLVVTSTNAITGTFSLSVPITNTTARYVQDNLPTQEGRYRARFAFNPNAITMATNDAFVLFQAYTGTTQMMRVELVRAAAGYQLRVAARNDASTWSTSPAVAITGGVQWVEIDWQRSTGPGANNGRLDWWLNGAAQTAVAGIDNDTRRVDMVRLGAVEGIDAGTVSAGNRLLFDAFESRRAGPIGIGAALPDGLFANDFENGNTSFWQTTSAAGASVTAAAALVGGLGWALPLTGTTTAKYLEDPTPGAESAYRARFYLDPNTITMANNTAHLVFVGYSGTASTDVFRVELQKVAAGYQLRVQVRDNASAWQSSAWVTISDDKHAVELSWTAGSAGKVEWLIDGVAQPATATVNNSTRRIDLVRFGAVAAVDATTTGTLYLDAFESRRTTPIGVLGATVTTTTNFGYDPLYRLTTTLYSTGPAFTYTYDAVGNMLTRDACLTAGCTPTTTNYVYDAANRLTSVDSVAYTWDANGNLLSDGARTYTYDAANRLTALVTGGITTTYTYNGLSRAKPAARPGRPADRGRRAHALHARSGRAPHPGAG